MIGYTDTWSAVRLAEKAVGRDPIETFHGDLAKVWGNSELIRPVRWPLSLCVGRIDRP